MRKQVKRITSVVLVLIIMLSVICVAPISANAAGQTVINLKQGQHIKYDSNWNYDSVEIFADGVPIYCVQPDLPAPPNGTYRTDNGNLKAISSSSAYYSIFTKTLYYCYGGKGFKVSNAYWSTDTSKHQKVYTANTPEAFIANLKYSQYGYEVLQPTSSNTNDFCYMMTHLVLSFAYYGRDYYKANISGVKVPSGWYDAVEELYFKILHAPQVPKTQDLFLLDVGKSYQKVVVPRECVALQMTKSSSYPGFTNSISSYSLEGAVYSIFLSESEARQAINNGNRTPSNRYGWIKTGADGKGNAGVVPLQDYWAVEAVAPKGYALSNEVYHFARSSRTDENGYPIYSFTATDTPLINLQLIKTSANPDLTNDNSCYSLAGARYGIYTNSSCTGNAAGQIIVDKDGYGCYINSSGNNGTNTSSKDKGTVAYNKQAGTTFPHFGGTYYAKEIDAPKGYELDETIYEFKYSGSETSAGIPIMRAYDKSGEQPTDNPVNDPVGIVLQKRNSVTGETINQGLEGAVFQIQYYSQEIDKDYDVDTSTSAVAPALDENNLKRTWYIKTNDNGYSMLRELWLVKDNSQYISDVLYQDTNGDITIPIGTVLIKEIEAPKGYTVSDFVFYRRITAEGAKAAQDTNTPIEVPIDEQPAVGYIGIHKMNNSRQGVANAVYGLYEYATAAGIPYDTLITNAEGKNVFSKAVLTGKTYYIKELEAPPGYPLDETIYPIAATLENSTVETSVIQDIYEESIKGDIVIKKSSNDGIVSNLYFALSDNLGNEYQAVATDSTGTAKYTGLPVYDSDGNKINYTVKELGFKTTPGTKSYGGFTWTVKAENCIQYKGAYYEGVANNTFSNCEYAYSRYYYGNKAEAIRNSNGYTKTLTANSAVTFNFNNTVKTTDIEINKQSYDGRKSGFYFKIVDQNGKYYGEIKTNDSGVAKYSDYYLAPLRSCITVPNSGIALKVKYRVEELGFRNPGSGTYFLPDNYISNVITDYKSDNLSTSTAINFDVYNKPDTGSLNIVKSSDDGYISGLWFKVSSYINWADEDEEPDYESTHIGYDSSGNEITEFYLQTDSSGKISTDSLVFYDANGNQMKGLPLYAYNMTDWIIEYQVTELGLKASDGAYYLSKRYVKNDDVTFNLIENRNYTYNCHNAIVNNGKLQVVKTSEDNEISNIWFNVKSNNIPDINLNISSGDDGKTQLLDDLPVYVPGISGDVLVNYTVTELGYNNGDGTFTLPFKYKKPRTVTTTLNTDFEVTFVSINNVLKTGSATLFKQDYNSNPLAGSEWALYKSDDSPVTVLQNGNGSYFVSNTGKVITLSTDSKGKLFVNNLAQGDYYFAETKSPNGTAPYGKKIEFSITADSDETLSPVLTVKNNKIVMFNTGGTGTSTIYFIGFTMLAISAAVILIYTIKAKKKSTV